MDAAIQSVLDRSAFILGREVTEFEKAFAAASSNRSFDSLCYVATMKS
jgi:dTDP-4-amino-4,6-dideoxygalactose transaminase